MDYKEREFWALNSEGVPYSKGFIRREFDLQRFMDIIEADPRGGDVIGMKFDGKNVEFYCKASIKQMKKEVDRMEKEKGKKV